MPLYAGHTFAAWLFGCVCCSISTPRYRPATSRLFNESPASTLVTVKGSPASAVPRGSGRPAHVLHTPQPSSCFDLLVHLAMAVRMPAATRRLDGCRKFCPRRWPYGPPGQRVPGPSHSGNRFRSSNQSTSTHAGIGLASELVEAACPRIRAAARRPPRARSW